MNTEIFKNKQIISTQLKKLLQSVYAHRTMSQIKKQKVPEPQECHTDHSPPLPCHPSQR